MSKTTIMFKNPVFEARISGKWRTVLHINYHTHPATISFKTDNGKGFYVVNGVKHHFITECHQSNYPLKDVELRIASSDE